MKQDAFDAYASVTKVNVKDEDDASSPDRVENTLLGLNANGKPNRLLPFASIDKTMCSLSKWKFEIASYLNGKESSTHVMTVKIDGDTIQDIKILHGQV